MVIQENANKCITKAIIQALEFRLFGNYKILSSAYSVFLGETTL